MVHGASEVETGSQCLRCVPPDEKGRFRKDSRLPFGFLLTFPFRVVSKKSFFQWDIR